MIPAQTAKGGKPDGTEKDPFPPVHWLHDQPPQKGAGACGACTLTKAKKKKALERCFEQPVPAEVYEALAAQLAEAAKEAANGKEE